MGTNAAQDVFIKHHLNPENFNTRKVVEETASMFFVLVEYNNYITKADKETFYNLPYKDISTLVFNDESIDVKSDTFDGFITTVREEIGDTFDIYDINISKDHVIACYEKFASHIELALIQKKFMLDAAKEANRVASVAQKQAEFAKKQAKKAKDMSNSMVTNFVTILGVFATIIITVFGGMQIISATTKLLQSDLNLATLILVLSFMTLLIVLILWMLFTFIFNLKSGEKGNNALIVSLVFLAIAIVLSSLYIINKQDFFEIRTKSLIKDQKES